MDAKKGPSRGRAQTSTTWALSTRAPAGGQLGSHQLQELAAADPPPALVTGGEVVSHGAEARGAEAGVGESMGRRVPVGVPGQPLIRRDRHAAEHERPARGQAVGVQPMSDTQAHRS